ncbi:MAG: hypothetical protein LQ337_004812 [Flavoplaca oasis]|nr:MAG: hypothetical protein LQ337_004812 [Flavoplaca oasis]
MPLKEVSNGWFVLEENELDDEKSQMTSCSKARTAHESTVGLRFPNGGQSMNRTEVAEVSDGQKKSNRKKRKAEIIELSSDDEPAQHPQQIVRRNKPENTDGWRQLEAQADLVMRYAKATASTKKDRRTSRPRSEVWTRVNDRMLEAALNPVEETREYRKKLEEETGADRERLEDRLRIRLRELIAASEERKRHRAAAHQERMKQLIQEMERQREQRAEAWEERHKQFLQQSARRRDERREQLLQAMERQRKQLAEDLKERMKQLAPVIEEQRKQLTANLEEQMERLAPVIEVQRKQLAADLEERMKQLAPVLEEQRRQLTTNLDEQMERIRPKLEKQRKQLEADLEEQRQRLLLQLEAQRKQLMANLQDQSKRLLPAIERWKR